jgi:predicted thioredoxin/glutaredoxin
MLNSCYPTPPMTAIPTVLLEAFIAQRALEEDADKLAESLDEAATQRVYALYEGASRRATVCGGLAGHDQQAAAILMAIQEFDQFLDGGLTVGSSRALQAKLDQREMDTLHFVRNVLINLLDWHFKNGAGRLLPLADWLGLVRGQKGDMA